MTRVYYLTQSQVNNLTNNFPITSGCTAVHPNYPQTFKEVGVNERDVPRNEFLATTVSNAPEIPYKIVFGVVYLDWGSSGQQDEDYYLLNLHNKTIRKITASELSQQIPPYSRDSHHETKDYLSASYIQKRLIPKIREVLKLKCLFLTKKEVKRP